VRCRRSVNRRLGPLAGLLPAVLAAVALSACGSGARPSGGGEDANGRSPARARESVTMLLAAPLRSLDPVSDGTRRQTEIDWLVYTGLVTYRHSAGSSGTSLSPGLARALPRISDGGRTYSATLRHGLRFSDGRPVTAAGFAAAVKRALRTDGSPTGRLLAHLIRGAAAFGEHRADSISGVATDDATGQITIRLRRRDRAFDAVLAEPSLGLVPAGTPPREPAAHPPPGAGPYRITDLVPGRSFSLVLNRRWAPLPGIPSGHLDVKVKLAPNVTSDALSVLNNVADVFDATQTLPERLLGEIRHKARGRFAEVAGRGPVDAIFLNRRIPPFDDHLAREAVFAALSEDTLSRESTGTIVPGCTLSPRPTRTRTPPAPPAHCAHRVRATGDLADAAALVRHSGTARDRITVVSPKSRPMRRWMAYYAHLLHAIGYEAALKVLPDPEYLTMLDELAPSAQTGVVTWNPWGPEPAGLGRLLGGPVRSNPWDPGARTIAAQQARLADLYVIGEQKLSRFTSARIDATATIVNPIQGLDLSSLRLR
jgi:peptide/nickel transport system substrate-binding protein